MPDNIVLTLGLSTQSALSQLDRELSAFERRRALKFNFDSSSISRGTQSFNEFDRTIERVQKHVLAFELSARTFDLFRRSVDESIKSFVSVDAALAKINISVGLSNQKLKELGQTIFSIAGNTGQSFEEAAKAVQIFTQQGNSAGEAAKKASSALLLMRQSGLDLEDSIESITTAISAFKKETLSSIDVVNQFASVEGKFAVSSKTLAEAFTGVSEAAESAGINSKQLTAIITSLSAQTQASGPRIRTFLNTLLGNEIKPESINQFRTLGVEIQKANGQFLPAIQIIENISKKYEELTRASGGANTAQKEQFITLLGGSRNLNLINALLGDVTKANGIYAQSLNVVTNAQDAAIRKNDELNKTFQAQANSALQTATQAAAAIGKLVFTPIFSRTIGNFNDISKLLDNNNDNAGEQIGSKIGTGILKGIGNALAGPGLVIGGLVIAKLIGQVTKNAASSLNDLLKTNSSAEKQESLQKAINGLLQQQGLNYQNIIGLGKTRESQELAILEIIKAQSAARIGQTALSSSLASSLYDKGAYTNHGQIKFSAGGFLPNEVAQAISNEKSATAQNVGGGAGANPIVIPDFSIGGQRQTIVANDKEFLVPTSSINPSYNGPDKVSIVNPSMINSLGGLPAGAIPVSSRGFIPNAAHGFDPNLLTQGSLLSSLLFQGGAAALGGIGISTTYLKNYLFGKGNSGNVGNLKNIPYSNDYISSVSDNRINGAGSGLNSYNSLLGNSDYDGRISGESEGLGFNYPLQDAIGYSSELDRPPLTREEELFNLINNGEQLSPKENSRINRRSTNSRELRAIRKLSGTLFGRSKTKKTLKSNLINRAASFGLDPQILNQFNKKDLANIINNKILEGNNCAAQGLYRRGFEGRNVLNSSQSNLDVLAKIGVFHDGYVPNAAVGFGGLVGSGFSRQVYDAGNNVLSLPRTSQSIANNFRSSHGPSSPLLKFLLSPEILGSTVAESRGLRVLQQMAGEKLGGPRVTKVGKRGAFLAEKINEPTLSEINKLRLGNTSGFYNKYNSLQKKYGVRDIDSNANNIAGNINTGRAIPLDFGELYSQEGHGIQGKIEAIRSLSKNDPKLKARLNAASNKLGLGLNFAEGYTPDLENPYSGTGDYEAIINENGLRVIRPKNSIHDDIRRTVESRRSQFKLESFVNENGITAYRPVPNDSPIATSFISNDTISSIAPPIASSSNDLFNQYKSAGVKGISVKYGEEALKRVAARQGIIIGNGGLPPNTPIAPPAPSAPTPPPPRRNNVTPVATNFNGANSPILLNALQARNLSPHGNLSDEDLRKLIISFDKQTNRVTEPEVLSLGQTSPLDQGRIAAIRQSFNVGSLNLLSSNSRALPLLNNKGQIAPNILNQVKDQLNQANNQFKNPLNKTQIDDLAKDIIAKNLINFSNETQKQLNQVRTDRGSIESRINELRKSGQVNVTINTIQNSINRGETLSPAIEKDFLKQTRAKIYSQFSPQTRNDPKVKSLVDQLAHEELGIVTGQIGRVQNDRSLNNNSADFTNSFINKYGGIRGGATTRANSEIEDFITRQKDLGADEGTIRNQVKNLQGEARQRSFGARSQLGLQASFTLPLLTSAATELVGNGLSSSSKNAINGVGNSLAVGGTIASLSPGNPYVLGIAAAATALGVFKTALDNLGPSLEDLQKSNEETAQKNKDQIQSITDFIQARSNRDEVIGEGGTKNDITKANQIVQLALQKLPPSLRVQLAGNSDFQNSQLLSNQISSVNRDDTRGAIQEDFINFNQGLFGIKRNTRFGRDFLGDKFNGTDDPLLNKAARDLAQGNTNVGSNSTFRLGIEGLTKKDLKALLDLTQTFEDQAKAAGNADNATAKVAGSLFNFSKTVENSINQGVFQNTFAAQGNFNAQSNRISKLGGLLDINSDNLNSSSLLGARNQLVLSSIQNQRGLDTTKALGGNLDQLGNLFGNSKLGKDNSNLSDFAGSIISGLKDGSLFGQDAINALKKLADESGDNGIQDQIKKILLDSGEKLAEIRQNSQDLVEKQGIANDLANKALLIQTQRNFGGGIGTFTNPNSFGDISNPISSGISSLINRGIFNSPLQVRQRNFSSLTPQSSIATNRSINITNAGFGQSNIGLAQALSALSGGNSNVNKKINSLLGGAGQLGNDITSQRKIQFGDIASSAINSLNGLQGNFSPSVARLQREAANGSNNLDFSSVTGDLKNLRSNSTVSGNRNILDKVIGLFDILSQEIKNVNGSSRQQANTILKSDSLPDDLLKLQSSIDASTNKDDSLIKSTTDLILSQQSLNDTLKTINGFGGKQFDTSTKNITIPNLPSISGNSRLNLNSVLGGQINLKNNLYRNRNNLNQELSQVQGLQGIDLNNSQISQLKTQANNTFNSIKKNDPNGTNSKDNEIIDQIKNLINSLQETHDKKNPEDKTPSNIGVDAKVNVAVNVAGNLQNAKNLDGLGDIVKQYILDLVKPEAINKSNPPRVAAFT